MKHRIVTFDMQEPKDVHLVSFEAHNDAFNTCVFDDKGVYAVTGAGNEPMKLWTIPTAQCKQLSVNGNIWHSNALSSHGNKIVGIHINDDAINIWDVATDTLCVQINCEKQAATVTFDADGNLVAGRPDGIVEVVSSVDGSTLATWRCHSSSRVTGVCQAINAAILM